MNLVVILGKYLNDDGSMKEELIDRINLGIETYNNVDADYLAICGGIANRKAGVSEASQMYMYLMEHDFPEEKIIVEDKSLTTGMNARFLKKILKGETVEKIYLVSTKYHFYRTNFPQAHKLFHRAFKNTEIIKIYREEE